MEVKARVVSVAGGGFAQLALRTVKMSQIRLTDRPRGARWADLPEGFAIRQSVRARANVARGMQNTSG